MGLYVSVYKQIEKPNYELDEDDEPVDPVTGDLIEYEFRANVNENFPGRADDIEPDAFYCAADTDSFDAGSYSDYDEWREELARFAGYEAVPLDPYDKDSRIRHGFGAIYSTQGPFWELIVFSDSDGVIGSAVSAKLAEDFATFHERAKSHVCADKPADWFLAQYEQWKAAFEMAADRGAVVFG
ncbi:hypothetical protein [Achromobacter aloeverae]